MFCVGAGGSKALGLTMNLLPPGPEHIEKPSNSQNGGVQRGRKRRFLHGISSCREKYRPHPSLINLATGGQQVLFPSRDVDRIFSTNYRLSAEGTEYSYIMSSIGYCGCTMTRSSNRALLGLGFANKSLRCSLVEETEPPYRARGSVTQYACIKIV